MTAAAGSQWGRLRPKCLAAAMGGPLHGVVEHNGTMQIRIENPQHQLPYNQARQLEDHVGWRGSAHFPTKHTGQPSSSAAAVHVFQVTKAVLKSHFTPSRATRPRPAKAPKELWSKEVVASLDGLCWQLNSTHLVARRHTPAHVTSSATAIATRAAEESTRGSWVGPRPAAAQHATCKKTMLMTIMIDDDEAAAAVAGNRARGAKKHPAAHKLDQINTIHNVGNSGETSQMLQTSCKQWPILLCSEKLLSVLYKHRLQTPHTTSTQAKRA